MNIQNCRPSVDANVLVVPIKICFVNSHLSSICIVQYKVTKNNFVNRYHPFFSVEYGWNG